LVCSNLPTVPQTKHVKMAELYKLDVGCFVHNGLTPGYFSAVFCF